MLRNQHKSEHFLKYLFILTQQQRLFQHQTTVLYNKNANLSRQGKIMGKLFGQRLSGSKKRWFPSATDNKNTAPTPQGLFKSQFGKVPSGGDKNSKRRVSVLNKLFMEHITDFMATGEISEYILGKGLQISRVKISQDFAFVNVFWLPTGEVEKDLILEQELQRCSGLLRHELSQLSLMGVVPRIKFVRDKLYSNMHQVESLLRNMDFGPDDEELQDECDIHRADIFKQNFYGNKTNDLHEQNFVNNENLATNDENLETVEFEMPVMRHDVLGLDHKGIMLKILTRMKKSKQAWDQHLQNTTSQVEKTNSVANSSGIPSASFSELAKTNEESSITAVNSENFEDFLAMRREKRNTPERKRYRNPKHYVDEVNAEDEDDYAAKIMSKRQLQIFQAEDYLYDDVNDKKH